MERRALVVALALTIPLALYGIPYAYAASIVTYTVVGPEIIATPGNEALAYADCRSGDVATGGGHYNGFHGSGTNPIVMDSIGYIFDGIASHSAAASGQTANSWGVTEKGQSSDTSNIDFGAIVECMTPVTVAGIGVPQFGSLYIAIALGAVAYFLLSRRFAKGPTVSAEVRA